MYAWIPITTDFENHYFGIGTFALERVLDGIVAHDNYLQLGHLVIFLLASIPMKSKLMILHEMPSLS